ncbi:MAG: dihydropteroate synthase [Candidatus Omnitrophica bacterium]|jgi:dihydropteroate synthase|nr:dihydropteroate synthase [Candidatus Omnitrophota bacterium]
MQILQAKRYNEIASLMRQMKVDPYGIKIMVPKALTFLMRLNSLSNVAANILKQEMLSLGGDAAITKDAITGKAKKTDCLLIGNLSQFRSLHSKLSFQPFGLAKLSQEISLGLNNYQRDIFIIELGRYKLSLREGNPKIMGVINLTPDSFSGDGLYQAKDCSLTSIIRYAQKIAADGADIIDVGGESSRPGAKPLPVKEELKRTIPVIKILAKKIKVPISIDTYKPEVAKQALSQGAVLVNDISGLKNPKMAKVIAEFKAGVVIMHMQGVPKTMQKNPQYTCLLEEIMTYLDKAINKAVSSGIDRQKIIIDPGIGFGKTPNNNLEILKQLQALRILGRPIMAGVSRKSFIGKILNTPVQERINGTIASCVMAAENGASILRVHDVKEVKEALKIFSRINQ